MKVLIVDDHPLFRKGLNTILSLEGSMEVVGEASNTEEALAFLNTLKPDIAVIDLWLGVESGLELIAEALRQDIMCKFVVLSSSNVEDDFKRAKELELAGYLFKEASPEELLHALLMISKGKKYYDQRVIELVLTSRKNRTKDKQMEKLTPKEIEVLMELGKGLSNKEISQIMYITEYTVKKHVSQVLAKLNLSDRTQAALYANATGLVRYVLN